MQIISSVCVCVWNPVAWQRWGCHSSIPHGCAWIPSRHTHKNTHVQHNIYRQLDTQISTDRQTQHWYKHKLPQQPYPVPLSGWSGGRSMSGKYMYVYIWLYVQGQQLALGSTCPLDPRLPGSWPVDIQTPEVHSPTPAAGKDTLLTETHVHTHTYAHTQRSLAAGRDSLGPSGSQLLPWSHPQKHKHTWLPDHFTGKPGLIFASAHTLTHTPALPPVAGTTDIWASDPWSHSSCWYLDPRTHMHTE